MKPYTKEKIEEVFDKIIIRIENGESLRSVLRDENIPSRTTFFKWIDNDQDGEDLEIKALRMNQYARATSLRSDVLFEQILDISDATANDIITQDGKEVTNHNVIQRDRLRVDSRKWMAGKMNPKKYGDQSKLTLEGGDNPIKTEKTVIVFDDPNIDGN